MTIDTIIQALTTGGRHLGDLCFWQLSDASVDRATFEARWESSGLAKELLPEPPTPEKALKTAVRESAVGQQCRLIRSAVENEESLVFAVVLEEKHPETGTLTYTQEAKVSSRLRGLVEGRRLASAKAPDFSDYLRQRGQFACVQLAADLLMSRALPRMEGLLVPEGESDDIT
jgi:hypothetical protein